MIQRDRAGAGAVPAEALAALDSSGLLALTVPATAGDPHVLHRYGRTATRVRVAALLRDGQL